MHAFGLWEEAGETRENPRRRGENMQSPHRHAPAPLPGNVPGVGYINEKEEQRPDTRLTVGTNCKS